jgi:hypothetical protein
MKTEEKAKMALVRELIKDKVDYESNLKYKDLIDCFFYDEDQDYTFIGTSDSNEGALHEVLYKIRRDNRYDIDRFLNSSLA